MGYTTIFEGSFDVSPALSPDMVDYLNRLASTRRMKRDPETIKEIYPNWQDWCLDGDLGDEGEFFAYDDGNFGQAHDDSVVDYNRPPGNQPELWLQWVPSDDGSYIAWDENEKFYGYVEWLQYLIDYIFAPRGYTLDGSVQYRGEEMGDDGWINVSNNVVSVEY